jgi:hypothetical protein
LRFLIRFVARDTDFEYNCKYYKEQGIAKFDTDIHFDFPMIKTTAKIKKHRDKNESGSRFEIYTKPSLMNICKDLFNLTNLFLNALSGIQRVDEIVFPQLKLKKNYLRSPDTKIDAKLVILATCINFAKEKPSNKLKEMK